MSKLDKQMRDMILAKKNIVDSDDNSIAVSLTDIENFGNKASLMKMWENIAAYNRMLSEKITFVNDSLTRAIPFTRENLYLICAFTGNGKSTIAANISYPLWKENKKTLVISNEESEQDVLMRIACLESGDNFNDYKKGRMQISTQAKLIKRFIEISKFVKVLDVNYKGGLTTKMEGIKNALEAVKTQDYSCVLIDYYQLIQYSATDPSKKRYDVLNDLRIWLGQYIKTANIPIVMFAQLHSYGKRSNPELDSRIKECPGIMEPSTVIIEAVPDFENNLMDFAIKKDRFGLQGKRVPCKFFNGRYADCTEEEYQLIINKNKRNKGIKELEKLQKQTEEESDDGSIK